MGFIILTLRAFRPVGGSERRKIGELCGYLDAVYGVGATFEVFVLGDGRIN